MIITQTLSKNRIKFLKRIEKLSKKAIDKKLIKAWYYNGDSFVITIKYPNYKDN